MKITLAEMRQLGCRDLIVSCSNARRCWHTLKINADRWGDDVSLSDIEAKFVCTKCGAIGGEARPDYSGHAARSGSSNVSSLSRR